MIHAGISGEMDDRSSDLPDVREVGSLEMLLDGRKDFLFGAKPDACRADVIPLGGIRRQKGPGILLQVGLQSASVQLQGSGFFLLTCHTISFLPVFSASKSSLPWLSEGCDD